MSAMKRELERLADVVIWGSSETIEREFRKVGGLHDGGSVGLLAYAIETARLMTPTCACGADYHAELFERFPAYPYELNKESAENA